MAVLRGPGPVGPVSPRPVPRADAALLSDLRADLTRARYTTDHLTALLGPTAAAALHRDQGLPARRVLAGSSDPAATLARLFVLGRAETAAAVESALPRTGAAGLVGAGLAHPDGTGHPDGVGDADGTGDPDGTGALRASCDLRPYGDNRRDWWVASDLTDLARGTTLPTDHVLGIGGASTTLAAWTPRPRVGRALDLGTGCGVQALHLLGHADRVCATDLSERALGYARFNAGLNDLDLDLRAGSLWEPVAGEQFDLIVSNPPFVITPPAARATGLPVMEYRDGAMPGDSLVAELVSTLGGHLRPGGVAQLLGNWEHREGEGWDERVTDWLAAAGTDGWVVQREVQDPAEYAHTWLRDGGMRPGSAVFDAALEAWLGDFAARGVTAVGFGYITLRRPLDDARARRHRVEEVDAPVHRPLGGHIASVLAAEEWLADHDDDALAEQHLVLAADVTEERYLRPGEQHPRVLQLRQGDGFGRTYRPGTLVAGAVGACDGELTLGQVIGGLSVLLDQPADAVAAEVLPAARELLRDGFLHLPAGG